MINIPGLPELGKTEQEQPVNRVAEPTTPKPAKRTSTFGTGEFKNNAMIVLTPVPVPNARYRQQELKMGLTKVNYILENLEEIKAWAEQQKELKAQNSK